MLHALIKGRKAAYVCLGIHTEDDVYAIIFDDIVYPFRFYAYY